MPGSLPGSLPNLAASSSMFRSHTAVNMAPLAPLNHSMGNFSHDLTHMLQAQRDNQYQQEAAARSMSGQFRVESPFGVTDRDANAHFEEHPTPLHVFGEEMTNDMGLMDGDMLEMLLKPE